ncbi:hypothetical protein B0E52_00045 [Rhodanobacter sp. C06]|uniref:murein hydrolase activator EnvC family protein n=1 Tax=Rhodanobacter sp. C06 TaxID=1945854 RepID=UPI000984DD10|nr:peptidoglycan DD-metalloendopeptidase family protein [Rhodanobacter sp. C06]OOG51422.1 hypothetical protein B0E52_00045 [Rhodanobacter sp. C06]
MTAQPGAKANPSQPASPVGTTDVKTAQVLVGDSWANPATTKGVGNAIHESAQAEPVVASETRDIEGIQWQRPIGRRILKLFDPTDSVPGVEFEGRIGETISAAADGVVVYSGHGLGAMGEVTMVKSSDSFIVAYALTGTRLTHEGQKVSRGDPIARVRELPNQHAGFIFQIRFNGNPVDPLKYLPSSENIGAQ